MSHNGIFPRLRSELARGVCFTVPHKTVLVFSPWDICHNFLFDRSCHPSECHSHRVYNVSTNLDNVNPVSTRKLLLDNEMYLARINPGHYVYILISLVIVIGTIRKCITLVLGIVRVKIVFACVSLQWVHLFTFNRRKMLKYPLGFHHMIFW